MENVQTLSRVELAPQSTSLSMLVRRAGEACAPAAALILRWRQRAKTRRQLALLDDRLARDVGLDPEEVRFERTRSFWQGYAIARFADLESARRGRVR